METWYHGIVFWRVPRISQPQNPGKLSYLGYSKHPSIQDKSKPSKTRKWKGTWETIRIWWAWDILASWAHGPMGRLAQNDQRSNVVKWLPITPKHLWSDRTRRVLFGGGVEMSAAHVWVDLWPFAWKPWRPWRFMYPGAGWTLIPYTIH